VVVNLINFREAALDGQAGSLPVVCKVPIVEHFGARLIGSFGRESQHDQATRRFVLIEYIQLNEKTGMF
jgi:hypothetical protein